MKIYESQHYEYVQNTNKSLEMIGKKEKNMYKAIFQNNDNL